MVEENKLPEKAAFSSLLWELGRMLPGAGDHSKAEQALGFVCTCSSAGLRLCSGCLSNRDASKGRQSSPFMFVVSSRRC